MPKCYGKLQEPYFLITYNIELHRNSFDLITGAYNQSIIDMTDAEAASIKPTMSVIIIFL